MRSCDDERVVGKLEPMCSERQKIVRVVRNNVIFVEGEDPAYHALQVTCVPADNDRSKSEERDTVVMPEGNITSMCSSQTQTLGPRVSVIFA